MLQLIGLVAGAISLGGAFYFLFVRIGECRSAKASEKWPTAPGKITNSTLRRFNSLRPVFVPVVEYAFTANGHDQTGKRIAYRVIASRDPQIVKAVADKYPVGAKVKITYDPANPADSVLEPGPEGTKVFTNDVIWFFCVGAAAILTNLLL